MNNLVLELKKKPRLGLEAENLTPCKLEGMTLDEIKKLKVYEGKWERELGEYFSVSGVPGDHITLVGDLSGIHRIGEGMVKGELVIEGNAGIYLGKGMKGGKITVKGDVASWAGMEMAGGLINVQGDAGNYLGSGYRGSGLGMSGGEIRVRGCAGCNTGAGMVGGLIVVGKDTGEFTGYGMKRGRIRIEGMAARGLGAEMTGGEITVRKGVEEMLPSFTEEEEEVFRGDWTVEGEGVIRLK
ncbi:MAG: formylmethanofuran dehydrogenase subunit C [Candidatus Altiarchaeota archaeon]|nr:formylmethanofuran dehydrogenase subunit C [Candidatus Altiarchaeota archaeon]